MYYLPCWGLAPNTPVHIYTPIWSHHFICSWCQLGKNSRVQRDRHNQCQETPQCQETQCRKVQESAVHATTLPSLWVLCLINNSPTILLLVWVSPARALVCQEIYQLAPFESYQSRNLPLGTGCPNKIQNVTNFAVLSIKDISHSILFNVNPRNFRHTNQETVWAVCYSKWLRQSRQTILMIQLFSWNWK